MKRRPSYLPWYLALLGGMCCVAAQDYQIDWYTIDGGGGTSVGGAYTVSGTIGQPDASPEPLLGGGYELTGGFWPAWTLPSQNGLPALLIQVSPSGVTISWPPQPSGVLLEETTDLTSGDWQPSPASNGTAFLPTGEAVFYRLVR